MKISLDLNYILKRVIVVVLAFVIISSIKSCDVNAATSRNYDPTGAWGYEIENNNNVNILSSKTSVQSGGSVYYWRFESAKPKIRLSYSSWNDETGYYDLFFSIYGRSEETNSVILQLSSGYYNCDVKSNSFNAPNSTNDFNYNTGSFQTVSCYNVPMVSSGYFTIYIVGSSSYTSGGSTTYIYISKVITNIKKESVSQAINDQSSQQHTDSQNTQNAINGVGNTISSTTTDSNTNNANGIFDVDLNGQSTNSAMTDHYGLESIITSPIAMLSYAQNQCQPISFTIFGKSITLPCGDTLFWNRDFSSQQSIFSSGVSGSGLNNTRNTFRAIWNALFGGAIIFHLLLKLYEVIQKAIDPVSDEYVDIRSAIDTGKSVRDTDGDVVLDRPRVHVSALGATNVDSYLMNKGV